MTWSMRGRVEGLGLRSPVVISAQETLRAAAHKLWMEDVGAVVVEDGGHPTGIVSERDLVHRAAQGEDFDVVTVGEVMTTGLISARPDDTVGDAAYQMLQNGIRHLPVQDVSGRLIGMVSIRDLLRPLIAEPTRSPLAP